MFENQNQPASSADRPVGNTGQGINSPSTPVGVPQSNVGAVPASSNAPQPAVAANKPAAPADMFSEVEPVSAAGNPAAYTSGWQRPAPPKPAVFQAKPAAPSGEPTQYNYEETPPGFNLKRILVLGGLVVVLAVLAGGGYWGYKKYSSVSSGNVKEPIPTPQVADENTNTQPVENPVSPSGTTDPVSAVTNEVATTTNNPVASPADADDDGLTNEEEASLGTNSAAVDSDNDGLFDREEVKVYGTDPLKADTDSDGYSDGQEVKGGFNPLGWGKLFDPSNPANNIK